MASNSFGGEFRTETIRTSPRRLSKDNNRWSIKMSKQNMRLLTDNKKALSVQQHLFSMNAYTSAYQQWGWHTGSRKVKKGIKKGNPGLC